MVLRVLVKNVKHFDQKCLVGLIKEAVILHHEKTILAINIYQQLKINQYEKEITYPTICDGGDSRQRI